VTVTTTSTYNTYNTKQQYPRKESRVGYITCTLQLLTRSRKPTFLLLHKRLILWWKKFRGLWILYTQKFGRIRSCPIIFFEKTKITTTNHSTSHFIYAHIYLTQRSVCVAVCVYIYIFRQTNITYSYYKKVLYPIHETDAPMGNKYPDS